MVDCVRIALMPEWGQAPSPVIVPVSAVLVGRGGAGKTTLTNILCGTEHFTGHVRSSATRNLFELDVIHGNTNMTLRDTVAADSREGALAHKVQIHAALTAKPLNCIFVVLSYENRFDRLVDKYYEITEMLTVDDSDYEARCVAVVTHWDTVLDEQKTFHKLKEMFHDERISFICCSSQSDPTDVAEALAHCARQQPEAQLNIPRDDFLARAKIADLKARQRKDLEHFETESRAIGEQLLKMLVPLPSEQRDEAGHYLLGFYRTEIEKLRLQSEAKFKGEMLDLDYYLVHTEMQGKSAHLCLEFRNKVLSLMTYNPYDMADPRNCIKRCPRCGLVWVKVAGCDHIQCGNLTLHGGDLGRDVLTTDATSFSFVVQAVAGGGYRLVQKAAQSVQSVLPESVRQGGRDVFASLFHTWLSGRLTGQDPEEERKPHVGCGYEGKWSELLPVPPELLKALFDVKTMDAAKTAFQVFAGRSGSSLDGIDTHFYQTETAVASP